MTLSQCLKRLFDTVFSRSKLRFAHRIVSKLKYTDKKYIQKQIELQFIIYMQSDTFYCLMFQNVKCEFFKEFKYANNFLNLYLNIRPSTTHFNLHDDI